MVIKKSFYPNLLESFAHSLVREKNYNVKIIFQRCTHSVYCSVLSLGYKVNKSLTWDPSFTKKTNEIFWS